LIHELFHYYKFDFHYNSPTYNQLYKYINVGTVDGPDRINECYTESIALLLYCLYKSVLENTGYDNILNSFKNCLTIELNFSLFQISKIIHLMNGKNINELFNNTIILKQNTNVRSYFIIKFILLLNLDELYNFIKKRIGCK
jgi:hypothetical protein